MKASDAPTLEGGGGMTDDGGGWRVGGGGGGCDACAVLAEVGG